MNHIELIQEVVNIVESKIRKYQSGQTPILYGTWQQSESVDPNLSQVFVEGQTSNTRGVRKLAHVTGLAVGDQVMMYRCQGTPLTIIGKVVGDIRLLEVG